MNNKVIIGDYGNRQRIKVTKVFCNRCKRMTRLDGEYVCKQCAKAEKLTQWGRG